LNLAYTYGNTVVVMQASSPFANFTATVNSYTQATGILNLYNITSINGTFTNSSFYTVNLSGQVGPTGITGPTGSVLANFQAVVKISYYGGVITPHTVTVTPNTFYTSISINGSCIILNGVTKGVPDYIAVKGLQTTGNFNNLVSAPYVIVNSTPPSSVFQVGYDAINSQMFIYDTSSTTFRISSDDTNNLPAPQVSIGLTYFV